MPVLVFPRILGWPPLRAAWSDAGSYFAITPVGHAASLSCTTGYCRTRPAQGVPPSPTDFVEQPASKRTLLLHVATITYLPIPVQPIHRARDLESYPAPPRPILAPVNSFTRTRRSS